MVYFLAHYVEIQIQNRIITILKIDLKNFIFHRDSPLLENEKTNENKFEALDQQFVKQGKSQINAT